jgi:hypothetical protein
LAVPLHNLGLLLLEQDRLDEAGPLLERAERLADKAGTPDGGRALVVARTLVRYYQATGEADKAAAAEQKANALALESMME